MQNLAQLGRSVSIPMSGAEINVRQHKEGDEDNVRFSDRVLVIGARSFARGVVDESSGFCRV